MLVSSDLTRDGSGFGPGFFLSTIRAPDMFEPSSGNMIDQRPSPLDYFPIHAERQTAVFTYRLADWQKSREYLGFSLDLCKDGVTNRVS
jgi:hypothetical protein